MWGGDKYGDLGLICFYHVHSAHNCCHIGHPCRKSNGTSCKSFIFNVPATSTSILEMTDRTSHLSFVILHPLNGMADLDPVIIIECRAGHGHSKDRCIADAVSGGIDIEDRLNGRLPIKDGTRKGEEMLQCRVLTRLSKREHGILPRWKSQGNFDLYGCSWDGE